MGTGVEQEYKKCPAFGAELSCKFLTKADAEDQTCPVLNGGSCVARVANARVHPGPSINASTVDYYTTASYAEVPSSQSAVILAALLVA